LTLVVKQSDKAVAHIEETRKHSYDTRERCFNSRRARKDFRDFVNATERNFRPERGSLTFPDARLVARCSHSKTSPEEDRSINGQRERGLRSRYLALLHLLRRSR